MRDFLMLAGAGTMGLLGLGSFVILTGLFTVALFPQIVG